MEVCRQFFINCLVMIDSFSLKQKRRQTQEMQNILIMYEEAYGQAISLPKSEIYYSRNVPDAFKRFIINIMGVQVVLGTGKYLGLPLMIGRDRTTILSYIKDRAWQKINS